MKPKTVLILGAGPCGLACAFQLLKSSPHFKVVVLDKASWVGGAGGSFSWKNHRLDFGPHAFHTRGGEPVDLVRQLYLNDPENLLEGRKNVSIFLKNRFFKYPLQLMESLQKFNPLLSLRIFFEFLFSSLLHALVSIPIENFETWGKKRFGPTLYRLGFGDYSEKVWKTPASKISEKFASEKIQGFSFLLLIKKILKIGGQLTEPYFQTWLYPRLGSGELYVRLGKEIEQLGGQIFLKSTLQEIVTSSPGKITVRYSQEGMAREVEGDFLVNTLPLPSLIALLSPRTPFSVTHSAHKLKYISLILVFVEFDQEKVSDHHWFYLLDPHFRFNRVTEQKNLSADTLEKGKTILSLELTCRAGDSLWNLPDQELIRMAKEDLSRIPFVDSSKITDVLVRRVPQVYEIYYKDFDKHVDMALSYISNLGPVVSIGRRGLFLQGDQHQSVQMGIEMAGILAGNSPAERILQFYKKYARFLDESMDLYHSP